MAMYWEDGTVTGSVNVEEDEAIQKLLKGVGKRKLATVSWPIESAAELAAELDGTADDDDDAEPAKASKSTASKADAETAEAISNVDLPDLLDKATGKKGKS